MTIAANRIARGVMCVVFAAAAFAKAYELVTYGSAKGRWSVLESTWSKAGMIAADMLIVGILMSRWWRLGCVLAIVVAAGGNLVYAAALVDGRLATMCGCLGRLALTPSEHAILSMLLFLLAAWAVTYAPKRESAKTG